MTPFLPASRRQFIGHVGTAVASLTVASSLRSAPAPERSSRIIAFSKPFRTLNASDTADLVAEVGWDGLELPVRSKSGQITPEKVDDLLPEYHSALSKRGKEITFITTEITSADAKAEKILRAASKLGIKKYRMGSLHYQKEKPIAGQLKNFKSQFRDLASLNKELGIQGAYQNHSGSDYFGAPIWDIWTVLQDLDPASLGICFDIGHATIEGGLSWPIEFRLVQPRLSAIFVKDFKWEKASAGGRVQWCPLGEGMVSKNFFSQLKASGFPGPICQHHEYEMGNRATMVDYFKRDLAVLRGWLKEGGARGN